MDKFIRVTTVPKTYEDIPRNYLINTHYIVRAEHCKDGSCCLHLFDGRIIELKEDYYEIAKKIRRQIR